MSVPSLVDRTRQHARVPDVESPKPIPRFAIESRPPRRADSDPAHAEHALVSRKTADLVGDSAVLDNDLADEKRCERGAGNSDAEAREQDGAGLAAIRRAATARGATSRRVIPRA